MSFKKRSDRFKPVRFIMPGECSQMSELNNVELAKRAILKQKMLGVKKFEFEIHEGSNEVKLKSVVPGRGKLVVPKFVTSVEIGSFKDCEYDEVEFTGPLDRIFCAFSGSRSKRLKIIHPFDSIKDCSGMLKEAEDLEEVELSEFNVSNVTIAAEMFLGDIELRKVIPPKSKFMRVETIAKMFLYSGAKRINCNEWFGDKVKHVADCFYASEIEELDMRNLSRRISTASQFQPATFFPSTLRVLIMDEISPEWEEHYRTKPNVYVLPHKMELDHLYLTEAQPEDRIAQFLRMIDVKRDYTVTVHNGPDKVITMRCT